jgi:nicotinamide mononucleotide (NMN) deamidase PncC
LVYVAVAGPDETVVQELSLEGNRVAVRSGAVAAALDLFAAALTP